MHIDVGQLVWRTRGGTWDYAFVNVPTDSTISEDRWFSLLTEAYPYLSSSHTDDPVGGRIDGSVPYVAARVVDPEFTDSFERPVRHYFLLPSVDVRHLKSVPETWGSQLLKEIRARLELSTHLASATPEALRAALATSTIRRDPIVVAAQAMSPLRRDIGKAGLRLNKLMITVLVGVLVMAIALAVHSL